MTMWSSSGVRADASAACPECGRLFSRRGLAAHRRMRHGPGSPPETVIAPDVTLPPPALPHIDDTAAIARALEAVAVAVSRLESRLDQVLAVGKLAQAIVANTPQSALPVAAPVVPQVSVSSLMSLAPVASAEPAASDKHALERELCALLAEIASVRAQCDPPASDRPAADDSAHAHLGKLRRRQASILARLLQLDGDPGGDEMCFL